MESQSESDNPKSESDSAENNPEGSSDMSESDSVEVDPCVRRLHEEIECGKLETDHIFYKLVSDSLQFAQEAGNPTKQFRWDPVVKSFTTTIKRLGGSKVANCLRGTGFSGQKFGGVYHFNWSEWNIPLPSIADDCGYTTASGIFKPFLVSFLDRCFHSSSGTEPLIDTPILQLVPLVTSKDGMAINPGF